MLFLLLLTALPTLASPTVGSDQGPAPLSLYTGVLTSNEFPDQISLLPQFFTSEVNLVVYQEPTKSALRRGRILKDEPFLVLEWAEGRGCSSGAGWALLEHQGYACLSRAEPTDEPPSHQPRLVAFDHPEPDEYAQYVEDGTYERDHVDEAEAIVPFIYGKRWRNWTGPHYADLTSFLEGDPPTAELRGNRKYHFVDSVETEQGTVLVRSNGQVVPADDVFLYTISRFHGRDLIADPIPEGMLAAWAVNYGDNNVYAAPSTDGTATETLAYHQHILVAEDPVDAEGHWWELPDGLGPGLPGYVEDQQTIRHWVPREPPEDILHDQIWIDVDVGQQVLALMQGDEPLFITLVSTGEGHHYRTRVGLYRVIDKSIHGDMISRPEAADQYHVEKVPWVMHFWPRYALHGVFWHWGFGHSASHGCINLAPRDARYVFDLIGPQLPIGWHTVYETEADPGMVLRVRRGLEPIPDRRLEPGEEQRRARK